MNRLSLTDSKDTIVTETIEPVTVNEVASHDKCLSASRKQISDLMTRSLNKLFRVFNFRLLTFHQKQACVVLTSTKLLINLTLKFSHKNSTISVITLSSLSEVGTLIF